LSGSTLAPIRRPLTAIERRLLTTKIRSLTARQRRASKAAIPIAAAIVFVLWLWTMLASDAPWTVVTAFWVVVGAGLAVWTRRDVAGNASSFGQMARDLESALRRDAADVYDVRAQAFVEFEEIEDEGACFAFDLGDGRLVFVSGQEFYAAARWPSLDFSLVYVLDEQERVVEMLIDKRGDKASPVRTVPASVKRTLRVPDHLEVIAGGLDGLESRAPLL
jgi:hypothetical protein